MGVSVQELSKMIKNQDQLNNLTQEQQTALAEGSMTMDEVLGNAGGVADRLYEGAKGAAALAIGAAELSGALKESVSFTKDIVKGFAGGTGLLGKLKGGVGGAFGGGTTPEVPTEGLNKADKIQSKGGFKKAMGDLAAGFKKMGDPKVLAGVGVTALAGPAMIMALPAIPFIAFMSLPFIGKGISMGLSGLASGLKSLGNPQVAFGVGVLSLLVLSVGAGMLMFGAGVGIAAAGMSLLVASLQNLPFENLMALPFVFAGMAAGLGTFAIAGLAAMPVLLALTALGGVSAALGGLGAIGGGGEEGGSMSELIDEVRGLKQAMLTPVIVNLDGRKLAEGTRQATNYGAK